jgi:hypothetical protein
MSVLSLLILCFSLISITECKQESKKIHNKEKKHERKHHAKHEHKKHEHKHHAKHEHKKRLEKVSDRQLEKDIMKDEEIAFKHFINENYDLFISKYPDYKGVPKSKITLDDFVNKHGDEFLAMFEQQVAPEIVNEEIMQSAAAVFKEIESIKSAIAERIEEAEKSIMVELYDIKRILTEEDTRQLHHEKSAMRNLEDSAAEYIQESAGTIESYLNSKVDTWNL